MATRVIDDSKLQNIAVAIQTKDNGGTMTVDEMPGRIDALPSFIPTQKKVNFYTFRKLAFSYKAEEAAALTEMPEPPTIERFTFQKWNGWTVEKIKAWLTKHENDNCELNVGGLYVTTDGHTRINMHLREAKLASLEMPFCIYQMAGTVVIDWGDNSTPETITAAGVYSHVWQVNQYPADVVIDIEYIPSGLTKLVLGRIVDYTPYGLFNNETYYASCVETVELGNNIDIYTTFKDCTHLREINLPDGLQSRNAYAYAFQNCTSLALTVLPDGVKGISTSAFENCTNLALTVLPDGVTGIGTRTFFYCRNLALTVLPDEVTRISTSAFDHCTNLALTVLPDGVTGIDAYAFDHCTSLALTVLPDGVTRIDYCAFQNCTSLIAINIPDGVTSISSSAFYNCRYLYDVVIHGKPALSNTNAFSGAPSTQKIYVHRSDLSWFETETNWSTIYAQGKIVAAADYLEHLISIGIDVTDFESEVITT